MAITAHAPKSTNKKVKTRRTKTATDTFPLCACGCGEHTRGGKFRPGHDMILKSRTLNEKKAKLAAKHAAKEA